MIILINRLSFTWSNIHSFSLGFEVGVGLILLLSHKRKGTFKKKINVSEEDNVTGKLEW